MKKLSLEETQALVDKYARSHGQRGAARALTRDGYRSPEGCEIKQGHVCRIQNGSWTCFLAPESPIEVEAGSGKFTGTAPIEVEGRCGKITTTAPKAPRPPVGEPYPEHCLERGPSISRDQSESANASGKIPLSIEDSSIAANASPKVGGSIKEAGRNQDPREVRQQLRDELEAEEILRQEKELALPPFVPRPGDHTTREHSHLQRDVRISAVFSRRGTIELDEDREDYCGLPRLRRQPQKITSKPYEARSYGKLPESPMQPYTLQSKRNRKERD